jgi:hypothetical protein
MPNLSPNDDDFENKSGDPPEPYHSWEEYFEDFDRQLDGAPRVTIRQRIGNPKLRPADEIPDSEIGTELEQLVELLYANNVVIDFINDIEEREAYLFITEELLNETMDDVRIPDMYSHFIYEDFHPNDGDDIEMWSGEFMNTFFKEGIKGFYIPIGTNELYDSNGQPISQDDFKKQIDDFHFAYPVITEYQYQTINIHIDGDYATAELETSWVGLRQADQAIIRHRGISTLRLKRSLDIGWDVIQAKIIGWNIPE